MDQGFRNLQWQERSIETRIANNEQAQQSRYRSLQRRTQDPIFDRLSVSYDTLNEARDSVSNSRLSFRIADQLFEALPNKENSLVKSEKDIQDLFAQVDALENYNKTELGPLESSLNEATAQKQLQFLSLFEEADRKFADLSNRIRNDLGPFRDHVVVRAQEEQRAAERSKQRATTLSYCLFAVGWISGLLGRILRIPGLDGGDK